MTKMLEKAFKKASELPEIQQDELAKWMLQELEAEGKWTGAFAESEDVLARLAQQALADDNKGKTRPLDLDQL